MEYKANTIEEFFGTLQQSIVESWRKHLKTSKYSSHMALNDFYEDMPDLVDQLIEDYMGVVGGKVDNYKCIFTAEDMDVYEYLKALRTLVKDGAKKFLEESELKSDVDNILSLIDSTLYKLKELSENKSNANKSNTIMSLKNFLLESINESRVNESRDEGEKMYNGFKNILEKAKSAKDLKKYINSSDNSKYPYASEIAYMYLNWVITGWDDYMKEADPDDVWDEYESNINFDQFSDYCDEFVDFLDDHEDEKSDIYSQAEEIVTKLVPEIYFVVNRKHIEIPEE